MKNYINRSGIQLFLLLIFFFSKTEAQDFTCQAADTLIKCDYGAEAVFKINITNQTAKNLTVFLKRVFNQLPDQDWSSSLCFSSCYSPSMDSVADESSPIAPGTSFEASVHIFTGNNPGTAQVTIQIGSVLHPDSRKTFNFTAMTGNSAVTTENSKKMEFRLNQNYPNPFNPSTTIGYYLPTTCKVTLKAFNVLGNETAVLVNELQTAGDHTAQFNDANLPSGVYYYRLTAGNSVLTRKMIILK